MTIQPKMDEESLRKLAKLYSRLGQLEQSKAARENFIPFVNAVWPGFIAGRHHKIVAEKLAAVADATLAALHKRGAAPRARYPWTRGQATEVL